MKTVVIYHRADFDGLFCREIARKFLPPETEFIGWDFGDEPIHAPEKAQGFDKIIWIDHHASSIASHPKNIPGYRIDGVAACRLAWQWFNQGSAGYALNVPSMRETYFERKVTEPIAVRLAGEYDIWDKRDPDAETFQFGLRSQPLEQYHWNELLDDTVAAVLKGTGMEQTNSALLTHALLQNGHLLQRYQREQDAQVVKRGFDVQFEGLKFLALNIARCNSLTFEAAATPEHDGLMGFYWNGKEWVVSLYHSPHHKEHDLSAIAVKFGGGGHRGACGFRVSTLPFIQP